MLAALLDLGDERDVVVHPARHGGPGHPSGLSTFAVSAAREQHLDSQILAFRESGSVGNGHCPN